MSREIEAPYRLGTTQAITVAGTSAATSNAWSADCYMIRVASTTNAHIAIAAAPTATTSDTLVLAGQAETFIVEPGKKLAAIQNSAGGTLTVTEVSR